MAWAGQIPGWSDKQHRESKFSVPQKLLNRTLRLIGKKDKIQKYVHSMINVSGTSGLFQLVLGSEDDLAVQFVAVILAGLHYVLLTLCCQNKNMYNL